MYSSYDTPDTDTDYCGSGWDAVCFEVPKGQQPQRDGNCISYDNNRICGSYETE